MLGCDALLLRTMVQLVVLQVCCFHRDAGGGQ